ncbi:MAG: ABC transporter ATP-binding protein, partial [bacterium]|nr:ABC transporter ATP-binding protein [bacterium]
MIPNSSASSSATRVTTRSELWRLLRSWRKQIAVIIVSILAAEALAVIPPLVLRRILDDYLAVGVAEGLLVLAALYLAATIAAEAMRFVVTYSTAYVAQHVLRDLRVRLFAHLQRLPLSFYDSTPLGDVISRCTADVDTVDTLFSSGVANLVLRLAQVAAAFAAMTTLSLKLSLLSLLVIPPLAAITRFFQVHIRQAERRRRQAIGMLNVHLQETLSGIDVVRAFGREAAFTARFRRALQEAVAAFWGSESYNMFYAPLLAVIVATCSALFLWIGTGGAGAAWGLSIGTIAAFILLFQRFFEPIRNLGEDWQTVQGALSGIERIVQVLQIPADTPPQSTAASRHSERELPVSVQNVVFGYGPERPVVDNVSITVQAGEHLALVGRTGAGKSSLIHLICGLYAP